MRVDREDLTAQRDALTAARAGLHDALRAVEREAGDAARPAGSKAKRPQAVDLTAYLAAHQAVLRAEQTVDLATLDLHTAAGGDA